MTPGLSHLRYQWLEAPEDCGVLYYSEFDAEGWEMRRVDILRDGRRMFSDLEDGEGVYLSDKPILQPDQFPPEFAATPISPEEFEAIWAIRREPGPPPF